MDQAALKAPDEKSEMGQVAREKDRQTEKLDERIQRLKTQS